MMILLLTAVEFLCGSLMFSYWLGRAAHKDLKAVGDGNPGAFNLWSAAGYKLGLAGVALDFLKGYVPLVWIAGSGTVHGYGMVAVAAAPVAGHAFSPFLKFKGGKAIAVTFGVWSALTRFEVSLALAVILALLLIASKLMSRRPLSTEASGFQVVAGFMLVSVYLIARGFPGPYLCIWFVNLLILVYTNKRKLEIFLKRYGGRRGG